MRRPILCVRFTTRGKCDLPHTDACLVSLSTSATTSDNKLTKERTVLCSDLPPRIYESLKTLCCLADAVGPLQARQIASATKLQPAQTAKILQMLTWASFVESRRGTKGGYWLVTRAQHIRVTDVFTFFRPKHPTKTAGSEDPVLQALEKLSTQCEKELEHITIADLARSSRAEQTKQSERRPRRCGSPIG
jgi:Rrf2 family protein